MTFLLGQSENPLGRPKKLDFYQTVKDEYFSKNQKANTKILNIVKREALKGERWAVREWIATFVPKTTLNIATTSTEISEKRLLVMNAIGHLSDEAKRNLYDVLTQKTPAPVNTEAEVIEGS